MNKAIIIGNLGRDAEMRFTASGTAVSTFSVATTEKYTDRDGNKKEDTQWHRIVLWGKTAESLVEYLKKGKQVCIEGKLQTREWTDKNGATQRTTEIRADRVQLLGGNGGGRRRDEGGYDGGDRETAPAQPSDDDIPFAWILPFVGPLVATALGVIGYAA